MPPIELINITKFDNFEWGNVKLNPTRQQLHEYYADPKYKRRIDDAFNKYAKFSRARSEGTGLSQPRPKVSKSSSLFGVNNQVLVGDSTGFNYWRKVLRVLPPRPWFDTETLLGVLIPPIIQGKQPTNNGMYRKARDQINIVIAQGDNCKWKPELMQNIELPDAYVLEALRINGDAKLGFGAFPSPLGARIEKAGLVWLLQPQNDRKRPKFWRKWSRYHKLQHLGSYIHRDDYDSGDSSNTSKCLLGTGLGEPNHFSVSNKQEAGGNQDSESSDSDSSHVETTPKPRQPAMAERLLRTRYESATSLAHDYAKGDEGGADDSYLYPSDSDDEYEYESEDNGDEGRDDDQSQDQDHNNEGDADEDDDDDEVPIQLETPHVKSTANKRAEPGNRLLLELISGITDFKEDVWKRFDKMEAKLVESTKEDVRARGIQGKMLERKLNEMNNNLMGAIKDIGVIKRKWNKGWKDRSSVGNIIGSS